MKNSDRRTTILEYGAGAAIKTQRYLLKLNDPKVAEHSLIAGADAPTGKPTWSDAVELIPQDKQDGITVRLPNVERTWEVRNRNLLD